MILEDAATLAGYRARGWLRELTFDAQLRAAVSRVPERTALVDAFNRADFAIGDPQRLSYAELDAAVDAVAARLVARGIGKDDVVLCQLPNIAELVVCYFAVARIGAVTSAVPMQYEPADIARVVGWLKPRAVVSIARYRNSRPAEAVAAVLDAAGSDAPLLVVGADLSFAPAAPAAQAALAAHVAATPVHPDEIATLLWTSGTTGWPKCVPRSHNNWFAVATGCIDAARIGEGARMHAAVPLVNMSGVGGTMSTWIDRAGTMVLHQPLDVDVYLAQIEQEALEHTVAAPSFLRALLHSGRPLERALASMKTIIAGGAPIDASVLRTFVERFGIEIANTYGSNEGLTLSTGPGDDASYESRAMYFPRWGAPDPAQRVAEQFASRLIDLTDAHEIVEPGVAGELVFRNPALFPGYLNADGSIDRSAFLPDGFLRTGEIFEITADGHYHYVDRLKDMINRGGVKIPAGELEAILQDMPAVAEAALIGVPDAVLGERIGAAVAPRPGAEVSLEAVNAALAAAGIARYMRIERLFVVDALPRNVIGKVLKRELVERFCCAGL